MPLHELLPEGITDSSFLLQIDDKDQKKVEERLYNLAEEQHALFHGLNAGTVAATKMAIGIEGLEGNQQASTVILNAVLFSQNLTGYSSPDLIVSYLFDRRAAYLEYMRDNLVEDDK